ncbi:MAG: hypothetical protein NTV29_08215 [Planctomycetota bacterium]|nr:hypothetical protein [Planctomycetota bacterium]
MLDTHSSRPENPGGPDHTRGPLHTSRLILWSLLLGGLLSAFGYLFRPEDPRLFAYQQIAIWYSAGVTIATLLWTTGRMADCYPVFGALMNVNWRIGTIAGFALVVSATKWPQGNSLCLYLVGYYFPFVVLESGLSIYHLRSRREV